MIAHYWFLDFRTGEAREITEAERREKVVETMRRTTYKDGVAYIDCRPPADEGSA